MPRGPLVFIGFGTILNDLLVPPASVDTTWDWFALTGTMCVEDRKDIVPEGSARSIDQDRCTDPREVLVAWKASTFAA